MYKLALSSKANENATPTQKENKKKEKREKI